MDSVTVRLRRGREKQIERGHPWVFSGAIENVDGSSVVGAVADVLSCDGRWLARGLLHPDAALAVRLYTRRQNQELNDAFFAERIAHAVELRAALFPAGDDTTTAYRLVYSEADGLSGLIVDRYGDALAVQVGSAALVAHLYAMIGALRERTGIDRIMAGPDQDAVEREGLDPAAITCWSNAANQTTEILENGARFLVDLSGGQKTGFFVDQRANRLRAAAYARSKRLLSAYCYTGGFEVCAARAGALEVTGIDRSEAAIDRAREHHRMNGTACPVDYLKSDVPETLRKFRDSGRNFDMIILDPPRFVSNAAQKEKGLRAYKDINLLAMKLLTPGGVLVTFSCSGLVSAADFRTMIAWSASDAGRDVRILEQLSQPADHPILTAFPESEYLKGLICLVE